MATEHPAIYILRLTLAVASIGLLFGLLYLAVLAFLNWGDRREKALLGHRAISRADLHQLDYLSDVFREGQAAFAPDRIILGSAFLAGFLLAFILPVIHFLYALSIYILNLIFMTHAPVDPRLPASMYPWPVFRDNLLTILRYLPYLLPAGIVYGLLALLFGRGRQLFIRRRVRWSFLGIEIPGSWAIGVPLGGLYYFLAAMAPVQPSLNWLLGQYLLWIASFYLVPYYLHRTQDVLLYWFTRFHWEERTVAAARYLLLTRFVYQTAPATSAPAATAPTATAPAAAPAAPVARSAPTGAPAATAGAGSSSPAGGPPALAPTSLAELARVEARFADGLVVVDAPLQDEDVPFCAGLISELPGVEKVEVRVNGRPFVSADRGPQVLREAALLRGERRERPERWRSGPSQEARSLFQPEAEESRSSRSTPRRAALLAGHVPADRAVLDRVAFDRAPVAHGYDRSPSPPRLRPRSRPRFRFRFSLGALQVLLFAVGALFLGTYFYGPAAFRALWPERVYGQPPDSRIEPGLELRAAGELPSLPLETSPSPLFFTDSGSLLLLDTNGRLWRWTAAARALSARVVDGTTAWQPPFEPLTLPGTPGERVTHAAPAPGDGDRLLLAVEVTGSSTGSAGPPGSAAARASPLRLVWYDPGSQQTSELPVPPSINEPLLPTGARSLLEIGIAQVIVDHRGRPYVVVREKWLAKSGKEEAGKSTHEQVTVYGWVSSRWVPVYRDGPGFIELVPSYEDGLPLVELRATPPLLKRVGYQRDDTFPVRNATWKNGSGTGTWQAAAMSPSRYLALSSGDGSLVQIAPDGYPVSRLTLRNSPVFSPADDPGRQRIAIASWSDPEGKEEWVVVLGGNRFAAFQPDGSGRLIRDALRLTQASRLADATSVWKNVAARSPGLPQARLALGKAYFESEEWQKAAAAFYYAGDRAWLERALANLDREVRRGWLLWFLIAGIAFILTSIAASFVSVEPQ